MSINRNFGFDVLRGGGSVIIVAFAHGDFLFYHLWPNQHALWYFGCIALDMFFVLSGFLIGGILLDSINSGKGWLRLFWLRRWFRTLPNYYLFLAINIGLWLWLNGPVPHWQQYLVFIQNLAWTSSPFFPESWSLALEEMFYLTAPLVFLIAALNPKKPRRTLFVCGFIIISAVLARTIWVLSLNPTWDEGVKKVVLVRGDAIAYGVLAVQWVRYRQPTLRQITHLAYGGLCLLLIAAVIFLTSNEDESNIARILPLALHGIAFAMLMPFFAKMDGQRAPAWLRLVINRLAVWSYSWYLTHLAFMRIIVGLVPQHFGWALTTVEFAVYVAGSLTWAWLNYTFFERPILRWRDRNFGGSEFQLMPRERQPSENVELKLADAAPVSQDASTEGTA